MFALREPPRTGLIAKNPPLWDVWPELWGYRSIVVPLLLARGSRLDIFATAYLDDPARTNSLLEADPALVHARDVVGMTTCGSMCKMALSRSFIAYLVKSALA